ncbi:hypothetical protein EST38_g13378 [Candolleomyces aberdarensis]|uniref:Nephrocystin 3-like N-terminal domain-containing protein n=1 Tax=Candolleomyces aberdarensis TaxID=2316362 RepID=A0A4Q2D1Y7_9AGAR|nr:hypothetical protein EST38_g13378 [Candolleomyces aberdarensis]
MSDGSVQPQNEESRAGDHEVRSLMLRDVNIVHYDGTVNNIERVENAYFGDNFGAVYQGADRSQPVAVNREWISFSSFDRFSMPLTLEIERLSAKLGVLSRTLLWNTHVLWLYGYVGCGKSAIALAIALKFERRKRLVGSFFFFRNTGDRSRMTKFATTLACQLAAAIPEAAPFIKKAVKEEPGLLGSSLVAQLRRLVYEPLQAATKRVRLLNTFLLKGPFLIVIDALDECEDRKGVEAFIEDMLDFFKKNPLVPLRFFITSRVEQHIQGHLNNNQVRLENLVNHCTRDDVDTFMSTCFEVEKSRNFVIKAYIQKHGDWPAKKDKDQLVDHIGGSFIFASTLFKYIVDPTNDQSTPMDRLPHTLNMNPGLDTLYSQTLSRSQHLPHFYNVISTLALLLEPLSIVGIAELLGIETFEVVRVLVNLQAIIHIPGTDDLPVTMCHTSLRDFLTTESRSGSFFTHPSFHVLLTDRCYSLKDEARSGTSAASSYTINHHEDHFKLCHPFLPSVEKLAPRFPRVLDALYAQILAQSQDLPHSSNIVSALALLYEPPSIVAIANLLGIEVPEVSRVLTSLQTIIDSPGIDEDKPVTMRHTSLCDFLTTKTRSGAQFVSPSYHLKLSYYYFRLSHQYLLSDGLWLAVAYDSREHCQYHWNQFLNGISDQSTLAEVTHPSHLPSRSLTCYLFSFARIFFWSFGDHSVCKPHQVWPSLVECTDSLALALECDPAPDRWLNGQMHYLGFDGLMREDGYQFALSKDKAMTLQRIVNRIEMVIRTKRSSRPSTDPSTHNTDRFTGFSSIIGNWTAMDAYRLIEWIATRAVSLAPSATTANLTLNITKDYETGTRQITIFAVSP